MRFIADTPNLYAGLYRGSMITPSKNDGSVQLRLEGMDAPETHYGTAAQPYGNTARDALLRHLGFSALHFSSDGNTVAQSTPKAVAGTIFTKSSNIHGRPIAYVMLGSPAANGTVQDVNAALLHKTINYQMVAAGDAYGLFYSSTPNLHRTELRSAAKKARHSGIGLWPLDHSGLFRLENQHSIDPGGVLIFPKLFRRCTDYLKQVGTPRVGYDLSDWLRANLTEDDQLFIESISNQPVQLHLHNLLQQRNSSIAVQTDMLDVVFIEK